MASFNKTILIGRLTHEPEEPRLFENGSKVVKFRIAVGRSRKNPQTGQWESDPHPLYIDCDVWSYANSRRDLADVVSRYCHQGDQVLVEGQLGLDVWEDKQSGMTRSKHKIVVQSIEFLGSSKGGGGDDIATTSEEEGSNDAPPPAAAPPAARKSGGKAPAKRKAAAPTYAESVGSEGPDPDIPF